MSNETEPHLPAGYHSVMPGLTFKSSVEAIDFYVRAFSAEQTVLIPGPNDRIMHAEVMIGDSVLMMSDEFPELDARCPEHYKGTPMILRINVPDVDAVFAQAVEAGAESMREPENMFWGERIGFIRDPFGYRWGIATYVEEVEPEEVMRRAREGF